MADISNVIQVSLLREPTLAQRANMNTIAVLTSELGKLSSANRSEIYVDISSVADDFGTNSEFYQFAKVFFSQTPNPVASNGYLVASYWRATDETVPATSATLTGTQLVEDTVVGELQQVTDGSFDIDIDGGVTTNVTGLDFSTVLTLEDIAGVIDASLTGATVTEDNLRIVITSDTTGVTSELTYLTDSGTGTFIGNTLTLASGSGAVLVQGTDSTTLTSETKQEALESASEGFRAFMFIDEPTDIERESLASYAQANNLISGDVFDVTSNPAYLNVDTANVVWKIKQAGQRNYRMFASKANDRKLALGVMARMHTVLFTGTNTANTENLKDITGVIPDNYTQGEILSAKNVGLDVYTTIKNVPVMLTSPANDFYDNVYNLIGYVDALEIDTFNLLKSATTKIPQTVKGVNQLVDSIEKTTDGFVKAGVFAPGTWTSPETFGDAEALRNQVRTKGYYVYANRLSLQPQSDRQARKSPPLQIAVKNAGAIHSANLIVQFNI